MQKAVDMIRGRTAEAEMGQIYTGKVVRVTTFGAFVEILPGKDGLVHISELDFSRVEKVEDICREGDTLLVKVIGIDPINGKIRLSRKEAMKDRGEIPERKPRQQEPHRQERREEPHQQKKPPTYRWVPPHKEENEEE